MSSLLSFRNGELVSDFAENVSGIGALAEPVRRDLYLYVCGQPDPVGRDEAAEAVGIPLHKAKFHLDRLEAEGMLVTEFARLSGKTGPGAGRPSKLYRRADREIAVSLPGREYELAGRLMAEAIAESSATGVPAIEALNRAAAERGRTIGAALLEESGAPRSKAAALELAGSALAAHGYEPHTVAKRIELANCPFHALAHTHTDMVCGMNLALIDALVETVDADRLTCHLEPREGRCCVVLENR
ncbi:transcriptional regulator [Aeromicrobium sp. A1-2]|nr:transcriptional regulator [Aeromicrobium sp. A1-2]